MNPAASLAFFGSLTIDDLVFADGSTHWGVAGGNAAHAALGAALWSSQVSLVAPLGADYPVETLHGRVDLARCRPIGHTLRNWGLYEEDGHRHFVSRSSSRDWGAFCPTPADAGTGRQIAAHVAPMPHAMAVELVQELRRLGTPTVSLDLDEHDLLQPANREERLKLIRSVDLFLPSFQDVLSIFSASDPLQGLQQLRALAPEPLMIVIKCGKHGVIAHIRDTEEWIHVPAIDVLVADTTGAGDAFCGGLLASYAEHRDPVESLLAGVIAASFCIEERGFTRLLSATTNEIDTRLDLLRPRIQRGRSVASRIAFQ